MEEKKSLREFLENQQELRNKLFIILRSKEQLLTELAVDIGISQVTLRRFLVTENNIQFKPLTKVVSYLDKEEKVKE